jgi:hypothetical protein
LILRLESGSLCTGIFHLFYIRGRTIIGALKVHEAETQVDDTGCWHDVSSVTFCGKRKNCGGPQVGEARRLRDLKSENATPAPVHKHACDRRASAQHCQPSARLWFDVDQFKMNWPPGTETAAHLLPDSPLNRRNIWISAGRENAFARKIGGMHGT